MTNEREDLLDSQLEFARRRNGDWHEDLRVDDNWVRMNLNGQPGEVIPLRGTVGETRERFSTMQEVNAEYLHGGNLHFLRGPRAHGRS